MLKIQDLKSALKKHKLNFSMISFDVEDDEKKSFNCIGKTSTFILQFTKIYFLIIKLNS